jgi:hypothetical protein
MEGTLVGYAEKRTRTSTPLRGLEPESDFGNLGRVRKTTEKLNQTGDRRGFEHISGTEVYGSLPKQNWQ